MVAASADLRGRRPAIRARKGEAVTREYPTVGERNDG